MPKFACLSISETRKEINFKHRPYEISFLSPSSNIFVGGVQIREKGSNTRGVQIYEARQLQKQIQKRNQKINQRQAINLDINWALQSMEYKEHNLAIEINVYSIM